MTDPYPDGFCPYLGTCDDDEFDDYWRDDWEDEDEDYFDCGFVPGEGCLLAGTEDCDFECPYSDRLHTSPHYPNCNLFGGKDEETIQGGDE